MAALDEMAVGRLSSATSPDIIKQIINEMFWNWYVLYQNKKVTTVKVWFISKTIYVRDLESVFVLLVGPNPRF